jgi:hypothetical protein
MDMKNIAVTTTKAGSPDGNEVNQYRKGNTYPMPDSLADVFIAEGWGHVVDDAAVNDPLDDAPEEKDAGGAPENKAADGPADDKAADETTAADGDAAPDDAPDAPPSSALFAQHAGGGRYTVSDGAGNVVHEGTLSKEEAHAMVDEAAPAGDA